LYRLSETCGSGFNNGVEVTRSPCSFIFSVEVQPAVGGGGGVSSHWLAERPTSLTDYPVMLSCNSYLLATSGIAMCGFLIVKLW
jgi:hypothetical protein